MQALAEVLMSPNAKEAAIAPESGREHADKPLTNGSQVL